MYQCVLCTCIYYRSIALVPVVYSKHVCMICKFLIIGEFGIVCKGVLIDWKDTPVQGVAVKALKGRARLY